MWQAQLDSNIRYPHSYLEYGITYEAVESLLEYKQGMLNFQHHFHGMYMHIDSATTSLSSRN